MLLRSLALPRLAALALPLGLAAPLLAQANDWVGYRGPHRDGIAEGCAPPLEWSGEQNLAWRIELPGAGASSPIILGDRVIVACYSGYGIVNEEGEPQDLEHRLLCLSLEDGAQHWERVVPGALTTPARQVQIREHGFASPTPLTDGERIYAYLGRAGVVALDLDGELLWQADLGEPSPDAAAATNAIERNGQRIPLRWGPAASPLLFDDLVIVNCSEESNSIRAFDRKTGELRWTRESSNLEGSAISPMLAGPADAPVLVIALGGEVWGLNPHTGDEFWKVETGTRGGMSPTPVADTELVYTFGGGDSHALRFAADVAEDERVAWKGQGMDISSPLLHDSKLFCVQMKGTALCLNAADGEVGFRGRLDGRTGGIYASPVLAAGRLYVVSREKGTFVYSADGEYELLAHNVFEDDESQFNASPALAGDRLLLRSDRYLYCVRKS